MQFIIRLLLAVLPLALAHCSEPPPKKPTAPPAQSQPPQPAPANSLIREGVGVAGAELGMTVAQIEAVLGKPERQNAAGDQVVFMSFHKTGNFGVYFNAETGRVRMIIVSLQDQTWCTSFDVCLYREGDLAKLKAHHGAKLVRFVDRDGSITYRLLSQSAGGQVMTEYTPAEDRNGIVQAAILYWQGPIDHSSFE